MCEGVIICASNTDTAGPSALSLDRFMDYVQSEQDNRINVGCVNVINVVK